MTNAKFRFLKWTTLRHRGIDNKNIIIEEITNKRGQASYVANYMIITSTACSLYHKLAEKGINISIGQVLNWKPFFITSYQQRKWHYVCAKSV